jgi:hypothetical protein
MSPAVCVWVLCAVFCVCWLGALDLDVSECVLAVWDCKVLNHTPITTWRGLRVSLRLSRTV